ncbi:MAG: Crp/Fnr family transcriptional regulator [Anaerolinea sp.]|nr:Crp/Fnr family transcriptional regulator [Anaerolinea sp.]
MIRSAAPVQLSHVTAFQHLDGKVLHALLDVSRLHSLESGDVLLYQGDLIHSFYIVQSGGVRLANYDEDGGCITLKYYGAGDVFGLLAISGSYPHPTQIEAVQDSTIIAVDGADARQLMLAYPELALTVIDLLTAHVHEGHDRVRHMGVKRVDRRLAQTLLKLSAKFGKQHGDYVRIGIPISQRDLAEYTGTTVETINRTLTAWEKQGWLRTAHKRIDILDRHALQTLAETA